MDVAASALENHQLTLSIRRLSDEFGMARETISKRLRDANVTPTGERNGYPVYRLRDACPAILHGVGYDEDGVRDPKSLPPEQRNAWFQSENKRMDVEIRARQLIPAAEHEADLATMAKDLAQFLETLPDQLERDVGLAPEQVEAMHQQIDRRRQELYDRIVTGADGEQAASAA